MATIGMMRTSLWQQRAPHPPPPSPCQLVPALPSFPSIKVPFESLKRTTRERKYVVEELETLQKGIAALAAQAVAAAAQQQGGSSGGGGSSGEQPGTFSREAALAQLEAYMAQLQGLKSKLEATGLLEQAEAGRVKARLDHLAELGPPPKEQHIEWNRRRVVRQGDGCQSCGLWRGVAVNALAESEPGTLETEQRIELAQPGGSAYGFL